MRPPRGAATLLLHPHSAPCQLCTDAVFCAGRRAYTYTHTHTATERVNSATRLHTRARRRARAHSKTCHALDTRGVSLCPDRVVQRNALLVELWHGEAHARRGVLHALLGLSLFVDADAVRNQQVLRRRCREPSTAQTLGWAERSARAAGAARALCSFTAVT